MGSSRAIAAVKLDEFTPRRIVLPWPDARLLPNAKRRKHWSHYRPAEKRDKASGHALTLHHLTPAQKRAVAAAEGKIALSVTFFPPDARKRDDDGMIGAFKHLRDGIALALGVDDNRFAPTYRIAKPSKPGRVEVELWTGSEGGNPSPPIKTATDGQSL